MAPKSNATKSSTSKGIAKPNVPTSKAAPKPKNVATEALKWLQLNGLPEETIAHRVAALMTGKKPDAEHTSNTVIEKRAIACSRLIFFNAEAFAPNIAAEVNGEVADKMQVIASEIKKVGVPAFMKLIPTNHPYLHRHVAVLLPKYDSAYRYEQGDSSSKLTGPDGFSWKTRRTPDADNDPRFPDFW